MLYCVFLFCFRIICVSFVSVLHCVHVVCIFCPVVLSLGVFCWFESELYCVLLVLMLYCVRTVCVSVVICHYGFHSFPVVDDFVCLYNYEFWLSLCKIVRSSVILLLPLLSLCCIMSGLSYCITLPLFIFLLNEKEKKKSRTFRTQYLNVWLINVS